MAWACSKCTYLDPPSKKSTCQIYLYSSSSFSSPLSSSVGSIFLPFQPCKRNLPELSTEASSDCIREVGKSSSFGMTGEINRDTGLNMLKVLSYNVCFWDLELHKRMSALGDLIQLHSPDVICLQEVTPTTYAIFQQCSWWKEYRCSISFKRASERSYFCMQLSKLPVKSFSCKPFSNSVMGRELCVREIELGGKQLVVATSHLESPCPGPPNWDQMYSKERVTQARESLILLKDSSNVIFGGDMNWDEKFDGQFPLPDGWVEAWSELKPGENGYTYDTKSNQMISRNQPLQKRLDRFIFKLRDFKISGISFVGTETIPGLSYCKEKKIKKVLRKFTLPVSPSDHYGLLLTICKK